MCMQMSMNAGHTAAAAEGIRHLNTPISDAGTACQVQALQAGPLQAATVHFLLTRLLNP